MNQCSICKTRNIQQIRCEALIDDLEQQLKEQKELFQREINQLKEQLNLKYQTIFQDFSSLHTSPEPKSPKKKKNSQVVKIILT
jgi:acetyl-CoA carboxylase alpha subunit